MKFKVWLEGSEPEFSVLKKNRQELTPEQRAEVMKSGAVWHHGPGGKESPAVWRSEVNGKTWFVTNTHRAYKTAKTVKGAIKWFHDFIKETS